MRLHFEQVTSTLQRDERYSMTDKCVMEQAQWWTVASGMQMKLSATVKT